MKPKTAIAVCMYAGVLGVPSAQVRFGQAVESDTTREAACLSASSKASWMARENAKAFVRSGRVPSARFGECSCTKTLSQVAAQPWTCGVTWALED